ncbi:MAG: hypothetical protein U0457_03355 [Candidatus Sericytochromatia bacterium]
MKKIKYLLLSLTFAFGTNLKAFAELTNSISKEKEKEIFSEKVKKTLGIKFNIFETYNFKDKTGSYYVVLTEDSIKSNNKTHINSKIKAFCFSLKNNQLKEVWNINDFVIKNKVNTEIENNILFLPKYGEIKDLDNDGINEIILVYGTTSSNNFMDGRIKILTFYKNQISAIRHQNGVLDHERETEVEKTFYKLPNKIQEKVKDIMLNLTKNDKAIFPAGWEKAMKDKKLNFNERH